LKAKGRVYTITAKTAEERDSWLAAFTKARDSVVSTTVLKQDWCSIDGDCAACVADLTGADADDVDEEEEEGDDKELDIFSVTVQISSLGVSLSDAGSPATGNNSGGSSSSSSSSSSANNTEKDDKTLTRKTSLFGKKKSNVDLSAMDITLGDIVGVSTSPVLLILLRHFGCMLCRLR
jgi:hypothetical protein